MGRGQAPELGAIPRCHIWTGATHQAPQLRTNYRFQFGAGATQRSRDQCLVAKFGPGQAHELTATPRCHIWAEATHQATQLRTNSRFHFCFCGGCGLGPRNGPGTNFSVPSVGRGQAPELRASCRCQIWAGATHQATHIRNIPFPFWGQVHATERGPISRCQVWAGAKRRS